MENLLVDGGRVDNTRSRWLGRKWERAVFFGLRSVDEPPKLRKKLRQLEMIKFYAGTGSRPPAAAVISIHLNHWISKWMRSAKGRKANHPPMQFNRHFSFLKTVKEINQVVLAARQDNLRETKKNFFFQIYLSMQTNRLNFELECSPNKSIPLFFSFFVFFKFIYLLPRSDIWRRWPSWFP